LTGRRRKECLEVSWNGIYQDPLNEFQDEYLNMMGQRLSWHLQALDSVSQLEHPPMKRITNTEQPSYRVESLEEISQSWAFANKDAFQEGRGVVNL
jgi:hypothetical protein